LASPRHANYLGAGRYDPLLHFDLSGRDLRGEELRSGLDLRELVAGL